jgi:hypothetical protein
MRELSLLLRLMAFPSAYHFTKLSTSPNFGVIPYFSIDEIEAIWKKLKISGPYNTASIEPWAQDDLLSDNW